MGAVRLNARLWQRIAFCRKKSLRATIARVLVPLTHILMVTAWDQVVAAPPPPHDTQVTVPGAFQTPQIDGIINTGIEYAGAASLLTLSYHEASGLTGNCEMPVYLVHDDLNLYVALQANRCGIFADSATFEASHVSIFLDPSLNRETIADASHLQLQMDVSSGTVRWLCGDGVGGYQVSDSPPAGQREVATAIGGDDVSWSRGIEIRLSKSLLGDWGMKDGLAIGHCPGGSDGTCSGPSGFHFAPASEGVLRCSQQDDV